MAFIVKADLYTYIDQSTINQLTDNTDTIVTDVIKDAENRLKERISARFDMVVELAKTGTNRNRSLLKACINLSIYYLFQRLYTDVIPEGRVQGMQEAEKWMEDAISGNIQTTLTPVSVENQTGWAIKWGSETKKGSQNY
jgi:phage gp36-like protein